MQIPETKVPTEEHTSSPSEKQGPMTNDKNWHPIPSSTSNEKQSLVPEDPIGIDESKEADATTTIPRPQSVVSDGGTRNHSKKRKVRVSEPDGDQESSENESDLSLRRRGRFIFGIRRSRLDERREKSGKRLNQSLEYAELVEDRLVALEKQIREVLREPEHREPTVDPLKPPANKVAISELTWGKFRAFNEVETKGRTWKHRPEVDTSSKNVLELLVEEPRYDHGWDTKRIRDSATRTTTETSTAQSVDFGTGEGQQIDVSTAAVPKSCTNMPFRIRIRSSILLKMVQDITSLHTVVGPHKHTLVLFRPFKLLVAYADDFRSHLQRLDTFKVGNDNPSPTVVEFGPERELDTSQAREELRLLCKLIDNYFKSKIHLRRALDWKTKKVSFNDLWYIFRPGQEIRTPGATQIQAYRIIKVTGGREIMSPHLDPPENRAAVKLKQKGYSLGSFVIESFYIHFDGHQFGPVNVTFQIRKFEGERDILSLPVIPFDCDAKKNETRKFLSNRGSQFAELAKPRTGRPAHLEYRGLTLGERKEQVESQVIIDFELAFIDNPENKPEIGLEYLIDDDLREIADPWKSCSVCREPGCCGNDIIHRDYEIDEKDRSDFKSSNKSIFDTVDLVSQLSDDQKILLPYKVFGFTLRSRRWDIFDLDLLTHVDYGDGWDNLVIDKRIKETVLALVENHARPHNAVQHVDGVLSSVDLVRGKGKGLIILLHGEPGVGKTSTAECVAEHTKRPLFPITCGDIGETAEAVESSLETNFQLAHKWGCVLLLDEADIFLASRTKSDIKRNAIISVFLRSLEYYSGILFLTTNRVGTIDRAFKSRIHLTLYFPKLNKKRTLKLWENNIDRLEKEFSERKNEFKIKKNEILDFCKRHFKELQNDGLRAWNGRQIRNAFQTAAAMARYEAHGQRETPVLGKRQFEKVAESAKEFEKYLQDLGQGKDDAAQAQEARLSLDDWDQFRLMHKRTKPIRREKFNTSKRMKRTLKNVSASSSSASDSDEDSDELGSTDSDGDVNVDEAGCHKTQRKRNRT